MWHTRETSLGVVDKRRNTECIRRRMLEVSVIMTAEYYEINRLVIDTPLERTLLAELTDARNQQKTWQLKWIHYEFHFFSLFTASYDRRSIFNRTLYSLQMTEVCYKVSWKTMWEWAALCCVLRLIFFMIPLWRLPTIKLFYRW